MLSSRLLLVVPVIGLGLSAAEPALAQYRGDYRGYHGYHRWGGYRRGYGGPGLGFGLAAGAAAGLLAGAAIASGPVYAAPPPVVYAPPPVVYAAPPAIYAPPPAVYAPPPVVYGAPGYPLGSGYPLGY